MKCYLWGMMQPLLTCSSCSDLYSACIRYQQPIIDREVFMGLFPWSNGDRLWSRNSFQLCIKLWAHQALINSSKPIAIQLVWVKICKFHNKARRQEKGLVGVERGDNRDKREQGRVVRLNRIYYLHIGNCRRTNLIKKRYMCVFYICIHTLYVIFKISLGLW